MCTAEGVLVGMRALLEGACDAAVDAADDDDDFDDFDDFDDDFDDDEESARDKSVVDVIEGGVVAASALATLTRFPAVAARVVSHVGTLPALVRALRAPFERRGGARDKLSRRKSIGGDPVAVATASLAAHAASAIGNIASHPAAANFLATSASHGGVTHALLTLLRHDAPDDARGMALAACRNVLLTRAGRRAATRENGFVLALTTRLMDGDARERIAAAAGLVNLTSDASCLDDIARRGGGGGGGEANADADEFAALVNVLASSLGPATFDDPRAARYALACVANVCKHAAGVAAFAARQGGTSSLAAAAAAAANGGDAAAASCALDATARVLLHHRASRRDARARREEVHDALHALKGVVVDALENAAKASTLGGAAAAAAAAALCAAATASDGSSSDGGRSFLDAFADDRARVVDALGALAHPSRDEPSPPRPPAASSKQKSATAGEEATRALFELSAAAKRDDDDDAWRLAVAASDAAFAALIGRVQSAVARAEHAARWRAFNASRGGIDDVERGGPTGRRRRRRGDRGGGAQAPPRRSSRAVAAASAGGARKKTPGCCAARARWRGAAVQLAPTRRSTRASERSSPGARHPTRSAASVASDAGALLDALASISPLHARIVSSERANVAKAPSR